jgi:hypothetical protein
MQNEEFAWAILMIFSIHRCGGEVVQRSAAVQTGGSLRDNSGKQELNPQPDQSCILCRLFQLE